MSQTLIYAKAIKKNIVLSLLKTGSHPPPLSQKTSIDLALLSSKPAIDLALLLSPKTTVELTSLSERDSLILMTF